MSLFLDIDRTRSVFRLLFFCSVDSYGLDYRSANFTTALLHVTNGVQIPEDVIGKLRSLYEELVVESSSLSELTAEVLRDFHQETELLSSVLQIILRISNDEGMLCARDRNRVRIVAQLFKLPRHSYDHFSDFETGMLASCLRDACETHSREELAGYFSTLGCSPEMTAEEIRRRYRELVMEVHPDRRLARGEQSCQELGINEKFREIQQAYQGLRQALS